MGFFQSLNPHGCWGGSWCVVLCEVVFYLEYKAFVRERVLRGGFLRPPRSISVLDRILLSLPPSPSFQLRDIIPELLNRSREVPIEIRNGFYGPKQVCRKIVLFFMLYQVIDISVFVYLVLFKSVRNQFKRFGIFFRQDPNCEVANALECFVSGVV